MMRKVKGRLIFSELVDGKECPIRNAALQLWDLDLIANDYLASGQTDINGFFEIEYNPTNAGKAWQDIPDLVLRLLDREYSYDKQGEVVSNWYVVKSFDEKPNVTADVLDYGTISAAFWEYQTIEPKKSIAFTPRADVIDGKTIQSQRPGRTLEQGQILAKRLIPYTKHQLIAKFNKDGSHPTNQQIEKDYPINGSTRELGARARSDEFISDLVLNGFNPQLLEKDSITGLYSVDFNWNGIEQDGKHFSPNTSAFFELNNNQLTLSSISVQKRIGGDESVYARYKPQKIYTPTDPVWEQVKRLFRCNYFLFGEVETHLNVEQYILPMRRNLLQNPVGQLLFPHFFGTTAVNLAANSTLVGGDGLIQKCSALTSKSVQHVARENFGTLNWLGWEPRESLCDQHKYAALGKLYWEVLTEYVAKFFTTHDVKIREYWHEVNRMSEELVSHALPFVPSDICSIR